MLLIQALLNGILLGALWAVLGLGKQIVIGVLHFVNFAHGHLVLLAMYASYAAWRYTDLGLYLTLPLVVVTVAGVGWLLDKVFVRALVSAGERSQMIATIGLALIVESGALMIFGPDPLTLQNPYASTAWRVGDLFINQAMVIGAAVAVAAFVVTWWFIVKTPMGAMIRATSQNREAAEYMGIDVRRVYGYAFILSVALAAVVGVLYVLSNPVSPTTAWTFLILMFVVPVLGGLGSIVGTALAGVLVGVIQVLSATYLDIQLQNLVVYVLFVAFLILRPQGLLGKSTDQHKVSV